MSSEDAFTVHIGIILLGITIISRETLVRVWDVQSTIGGTLQGTEDTAPGRGGLDTNIQKSAEGALIFIDLIDVVGSLTNGGRDDSSINFIISFIDIIKSNLLEETTGTKKTGAVSSGVVLKSNTQSITGQLVGASRSQNPVSINKRVCNLANNLFVGETNNETVFGRLVLVLSLTAKTLALTVVGLSLAATTELDLVPLEVRFGFLELDESLNYDRDMKGETVS
jgi:hypothetical protein